ncbi:MAG: (2Fe-2S)-binding protein [Candidatus Adiutrix sp.]|jgi:carbon-monoxide dehydrogenase small subunit|nr:(2Fe-2S)-binding protein [Candidatus Adiutrix sp.]
MVKMKISFILNGRPAEGEAVPAQTAVSFLRDSMDQRSVKEGCGIGECGACTIIVNGLAVTSCLMTAAQLDGATVETTEGLAKSGNLHPLQESFIQHNAIQCGYCTPGALMSAKALLAENPEPTRREIRKALAGNLCRCTGYQQIVDAVEDAAKAMRGKTDGEGCR